MSEEDFMLDTNIFGELMNKEIQDITPKKIRENSDRAEFYVTHIQIDEINDNEHKNSRGRLLHHITDIMDHKIPTEGFIIDTSRLGAAKLADDYTLYKDILKELPGDNTDNDRKDAMLATTAIKRDITFVTADGEGSTRGLQDALDELEEPHMSREDFVEWLEGANEV
jgi:predicted nucleic acid-binding protein